MKDSKCWMRNPGTEKLRIEYTAQLPISLAGLELLPRFSASPRCAEDAFGQEQRRLRSGPFVSAGEKAFHEDHLAAMACLGIPEIKLGKRLFHDNVFSVIFHRHETDLVE